MRKFRFLIAGVVVLALAGCATQRPVLYPNAKYKQAGPEVARQDVDDCIRLAEQHGITHRGGDRVAGGAAGGAAVGGATGAVAGVIRGRNVLDSAAAGAAVGGTAGATHGAIHSGEPGSVYKGFVQRCLRERGYDVIGWR